MKDQVLEKKIEEFLKNAKCQEYDEKNPSSQETTLRGDYGYVQMKKRKFKVGKGDILPCTVLYYVDIDEKHRGKGIGGAVMEFLKKFAPVIVEDVENEKFRSFLLKNGYKTYNFRPTNIMNPKRVWMIHES